MNTRIKPLPLAFYVDTSVDVELLKRLFEICPHPAGFSKMLAKLIRNEVPRKHEDRLTFIARNLPDQAFRAKWYKSTDGKRSSKKGWFPLFQMISDWVRMSVQDIYPSDSEMRHILFMQDAMNRDFIRPSAISSVIEIACGEGAATDMVALYLWAFAEAAAWRQFEPAQYSVDDINCAEAGDSQLVEYCSKVKELLRNPVSVGLVVTADAGEEISTCHGTSRSGATQVSDEGIEQGKKLHQPGSGDEPGSHHEITPSGKPRKSAKETHNQDPDAREGTDPEYISQLLGELEQVGTKWREYLSKIDGFMSAAKDLEQSPDSRPIISKLESTFSTMSAAWQAVNKSIGSYSSLYKRSLEGRGQDVVGNKILIIDAVNVDDGGLEVWLRQRESELEVLRECNSSLNRYRDCAERLKEYGITMKWEGPFSNLSSLIAWVDQKVKDCDRIYKQNKSIEKFKRRCAEMSENREWEPFADNALGNEGWMTLCLSTHKEVFSSCLVGVALRVLMDQEKHEYAETISHVRDQWNADAEQACKILSVLRRTEIENLWDNDVESRPALTVCVLNTWLSKCDSKDSSAVDYWYWKPLKEACDNDHISSGAFSFLSELGAYARQGIIRSSRSMQRLLSVAERGVVAKDCRSNELYDLVRQRVLTPPNYHGNYGRMATFAYKELFLPLHGDIEVRNVEKLHPLVHGIVDNFNYGNWFAQNSTRIARYLESHHKKKIQQYITERFHILEEWLDAESGVAGDKDGKINNLASTVTHILGRYEKETSHVQDKYIENIGWWISEIKRLGDIPVQSAGNHPGALNVLQVPTALVNSHEFPWRCIEKQVEESAPTWEQYVADELSWWANPDVLADVINEWKDSERIECLRLHVQNCEQRGVVVSSDLKGWLSDNEDTLRRTLEVDIKEIQSKLEGFESDTKQLFQEELDDIKHCFSEEDWYAQRARTNILKGEVHSALERYGDNAQRQQLCDDIRRLGGESCHDSELAELKEVLKKHLAKAEDRMVHVKVLSDLLSQPGLPEILRDEIIHITKKLKQPRYLPDASRSDWVKCVLETVFTPILDKLENQDILLPVYRDILVRLLRGITLLISNPEWVLEKDSGTEKLLIQISDRLAVENYIGNTDNAKQLVDWLSRQVDGIDATTEDSGMRLFDSDDVIGLDDSDVAPASVEDDGTSCDYARKTLIDALQRVAIDAENVPEHIEASKEQIEEALRRKNWRELAQLCIGRARLGEDADALLYAGAGLSLAHILAREERSGVVEALLVLGNSPDGKAVFKIISRKPRGADKNYLGPVAVSWLAGQDVNNIKSWEFTDEQAGSAAVRLARVIGRSGNSLQGSIKSPVLDVLWDYAVGEAWGADYRALLLRVCTRGGLSGALAYLLKKDPVKMQDHRAKLFAGLVDRATDVPGWERLCDFLKSERIKQRSKPFSIYAEQLLKTSKRRREQPATINIVGPVAKEHEKGLWAAVIEVVPSVLDPPQDIVLRLSSDSPVKFGREGGMTHKIDGPILDKKQIRIHLNYQGIPRGDMPVDVQCRVRTLQDVPTEELLKWVIPFGGSDEEFIAPGNALIERCFSGFPQSPMRGKDYIPRDDDEKTIEEVLFNSERAGSLWITSPRRSGKTTMLFRILDEFSYKKGRDDIVLYLTLSTTFDSEKEFNTWIWKRISKSKENIELKNHVPNMKGIGVKLEMDVDVDIFLADLSDALLQEAVAGSRVYYVFDEIDHFAGMYLEGGQRRKKAISIMWQLRNLVTTDTNVGIVFAGSHAARRFFIADAAAPFYNSISAINLKPFNVETDQNERRTRDIVLPKSMGDIFTISNETLGHLLRITAGIPYYMKLLAGAVYSRAEHARIFQADINTGVAAMLAKETGIRSIDMLENPGEDELRTLYAESVDEKVLIKGVLLAVANLRSPISGHPVNVGEIWSEKSPLVVRAGLSREIIEPALTSAQGMGFLRTPPSNEYQVEFSIPLLGESMRSRFHILWANIERKLEDAGRQ